MSTTSARTGRYAQAILQAMLERWQGALGQAAQAVTKDPQLAATLADRNVPAADKDKALAAVLPEGTPPEVFNLIKLMGQEGDLQLLPAMAGALSDAVSGQRAPLTAEVTSAVELDASNQEKIRQLLVRQYGEGLTFTFHVDPALMGGVRIRVGDHLIDNSVASRLASLRESLSSVVR